MKHLLANYARKQSIIVMELPKQGRLSKMLSFQIKESQSLQSTRERKLLEIAVKFDSEKIKLHQLQSMVKYSSKRR
jgi:hypothetical protein